MMEWIKNFAPGSVGLLILLFFAAECFAGPNEIHVTCYSEGSHNPATPIFISLSGEMENLEKIPSSQNILAVFRPTSKKAGEESESVLRVVRLSHYDWVDKKSYQRWYMILPLKNPTDGVIDVFVHRNKFNAASPDSVDSIESITRDLKSRCQIKAATSKTEKFDVSDTFQTKFWRQFLNAINGRFYKFSPTEIAQLKKRFNDTKGNYLHKYIGLVAGWSIFLNATRKYNINGPPEAYEAPSRYLVAVNEISSGKPTLLAIRETEILARATAAAKKYQKSLKLSKSLANNPVSKRMADVGSAIVHELRGLIQKDTDIQ